MVANFIDAVRALLDTLASDKEVIVYAYGDGDANEFLRVVTNRLPEWTTSVKWMVGKSPIKSTSTSDDDVGDNDDGHDDDDGDDDEYATLDPDDLDDLDMDLGFAASNSQHWVPEPELLVGSEKLARWRIPTRFR